MENKPYLIEWSNIKLKREEIKFIYPTIFKVPIIYGTKKQIIFSLLTEKYKKQKKIKILDIGAGDRFVNKICLNISSEIEYKSLDKDQSRFHDYYSIDEITEKFDIIFVLDVIEHLSLLEGQTLLSKCNYLLNPNGEIILSIPNNSHPTAFSGDCTHITSYRYYDLGALLLLVGFEKIQIFRVSAKKRLKHRLFAMILKPFLKFLDIDFATGILIRAKKLKSEKCFMFY